MVPAANHRIPLRPVPMPTHNAITTVTMPPPDGPVPPTHESNWQFTRDVRYNATHDPLPQHTTGTRQKPKLAISKKKQLEQEHEAQQLASQKSYILTLERKLKDLDDSNRRLKLQFAMTDIPPPAPEAQPHRGNNELLELIKQLETDQLRDRLRMQSLEMEQMRARLSALEQASHPHPNRYTPQPESHYPWMGPSTHFQAAIPPFPPPIWPQPMWPSMGMIPTVGMHNYPHQTFQQDHPLRSPWHGGHHDHSHFLNNHNHHTRPFRMGPKEGPHVRRENRCRPTPNISKPTSEGPTRSCTRPERQPTEAVAHTLEPITILASAVRDPSPAHLPEKPTISNTRSNGEHPNTDRDHSPSPTEGTGQEVTSYQAIRPPGSSISPRKGNISPLDTPTASRLHSLLTDSTQSPPHPRHQPPYNDHPTFLDQAGGIPHPR